MRCSLPLPTHTLREASDRALRCVDAVDVDDGQRVACHNVWMALSARQLMPPRDLNFEFPDAMIVKTGTSSGLCMTGQWVVASSPRVLTVFS
jgi:hypothetical protein